jgi:chemotaxis protein CheD
MIELGPELPQIYLQPGEIYVARNPAILRTVLGSCVGVTFWSQRLGLGALCHAVLPRRPRGVSSSLQSLEGYRYVDYCISDLVRQLEGLGAFRAELQVKLFGGADVLPVRSEPSSRETVGSQNWHVALEVLEEESLAVMASDLGGTLGRTIQFHTGTGEVLLRRLAKPEFENDFE